MVVTLPIGKVTGKSITFLSVNILNISIFPHLFARKLHDSPTTHQVLEKIKTFRVDLSMCLRYIHSFYSGSYVRTSFRTLSFHAYTSAPHSFCSLLSFHFVDFIHTISYYLSYFSLHFHGMYLFYTDFYHIKLLTKEKYFFI